MSHDVFISHAAQDREVAILACAALEERGLSCWLAPRDLAPGRDYRDAVTGAVARCRLVVLIVSRATADEPHLGRDIERALGEGRPLVALRLADVMPEGPLGAAIAAAHIVDAFTPPISAHLDYLCDRVADLLGERGQGPLMPTLPPRPSPARRRGAAWLPMAIVALIGLLVIGAMAKYVARPTHAEAANGQP